MFKILIGIELEILIGGWRPMGLSDYRVGIYIYVCVCVCVFVFVFVLRRWRWPNVGVGMEKR